MKTLVIIPAFNEAAAIGKVIGDLPDDLVDEVVVVNNASTDQTARNATAAGATVLYEPQRGYGYACLAGLAYAAQAQVDVVVFLDGDYSDHPEELPGLLEPIKTSQCDFVVGSRIAGNSEPGALLLQARFGNRLACLLMRWFWGARYTDLGPFRAIRYEDLLRLNMRDCTFGWTIEMQIKAHLAGLRTTEVPVSYRKRVGVSKITGTISGTLRASFKILYMLFSMALRTKSLRRQLHV